MTGSRVAFLLDIILYHTRVSYTTSILDAHISSKSKARSAKSRRWFGVLGAAPTGENKEPGFYYGLGECTYVSVKE